MSSDLTELDYADITIRFEPHWAISNLGNVSCTVFDIQGRNRKVSIVMPTTSIPQHVTLDTCERWINAIQGPLVSGCGVDDEQRELLLHLCLAYRAFVRGFPGINHDDWYRFASNLVITACEASRGERVDDHIRQIVEWLHLALPVAIFLDADDVPPIVYNDEPAPAQPQHIVLPPEGISRAEQRALRRRLENDISALVLKTLRHPRDGPATNDFTTTLINFAREEDTRHAAEGIPPSPTPPERINDSDSDEDNGPVRGSAKSPLYLTVGLPAFIIGSRRTPLVEILSQCTFYRVARDGTMVKLSNPLAIPIMAGPPPPIPSTPPTVAAVDAMENLATPTNNATPNTHDAASPPSPSERVLSAALGIPPQVTSSPARDSAPGVRTPSRTARAGTSSRRRRSLADIKAMNAHQRATAEACRKRSQEARDAHAAARSAHRGAASASGENITDSDDSMPSLRTVTDSSDDFISDLELAYPDDD